MAPAALALSMGHDPIPLRETVKLPAIRYPEPHTAPLGAFPTPAASIPAGKAGAYGSTSNPRPPQLYFVLQSKCPPPSVEQVENKLRAHVFAQRIRVADLFIDFDRLRSGYMTATQFRRCLGAMLHKGVVCPLTEQEFEVLMGAYDLKANRMIKWTAFVDSIDKVFGAKKLEQTPTQQIPHPREVVKPFRALSPTSEALLQGIITKLRSFVKWHGSDVKTWFKHFDKHNNGYVTINQFRRGLPQNLLSLEEEDMLIEQYSTEDTVNYFKLNTDVNRKIRRPRSDDTGLIEKHPKDAYHAQYVPVGTEELIYPPKQTYGAQSPSWIEVEDKIKKRVYKDRIRLIEFFRDYDRHNNGLVSEAQFRAGLCLASLRLKEEEMKALLAVYEDSEKQVLYRSFCESIDTVFTINHLEKQPLVEVGPIAREDLVQGPNQLPLEEESRCSQLLDRLHFLIRERHLLLEPLFKDFDMYLGKNTIGRVTRSHFTRLLSTMRLDLSDRDLHILFKKFEDRECGQINYMEFVRAVDPETYGAYVDDLRRAASSSGTLANPLNTSTPPQQLPSLEPLLNTIRTHVLQKRVRVSEFFRDVDKLRSYSIPRKEFVRGINRIGVPLSDKEYAILTDAYADGKRKGCCRWKVFEEDVERVFGESHLESRPSVAPQPAPIQPDPFLTHKSLTEEEHQVLQDTLQTLRDFLRVRQTSIKPFFKDFDKLRTGYVTKFQFRQCLSHIRCPLTNNEFAILAKSYLKATGPLTGAASGVDANSVIDNQKLVDTASKGASTKDYIKDAAMSWDYIQDNTQRICYVTFLRELEEGVPFELREQTSPVRPTINSTTLTTPGKIDKAIKEGSTTTHEGDFATSRIPLSDQEIHDLLMRIKTKAKTERIRVADFVSDFDLLHHGRVTKSEFKRALKVLFADLTEPELTALATLYQTPNSPQEVTYTNFTSEIESVFTKQGLESNPTAEPDPFPPERCQALQASAESGTKKSVAMMGKGDQSDKELALTVDEEWTLKGVLDQLKTRIGQRWGDIQQQLEDNDIARDGTVSPAILQKFLSPHIQLTTKELYLIAKRFAMNANLDKVDYRSLGEAVFTM
ncbi:hypothetical protein SpCBS45565_g01341 [Spizellomyces sp. 'palustris']|nr:hypothetical protein SpCBS45565_g01341 [Spizellomyces sp. 'palustris']